MSAKLSTFVQQIADGTADEGAMIALWHVVHDSGGRFVIDLTEPLPGWTLKVETRTYSRRVVLVATGEEESR
jgi:hypothetical protein